MADDPRTAPGPLTIARNIAFYLAFYTMTFVLLVLGGPAARLVPRWTRPLCEAWASWHRWCVTHLLGIRVRVEGEVPHGAVLVAAKHEFFFEAIDMPVLLEFPAVFAKVELMTMPFWGRLGHQYGLISVEREEGAKALRKMLAAARDRAKAGRVLVIFPEGTRVPHGGPSPLQSGFAGLYKLIGMPVVPLAVDSGPLYHRWWKRAGTITYRFGPLIPPILPRDEAEAAVQAAINVLNP